MYKKVKWHFMDIQQTLLAFVFPSDMQVLPIYDLFYEFDEEEPRSWLGGYYRGDICQYYVINFDELCRQPIESRIEVMHHEIVHYYNHLNMLDDTCIINDMQYHTDVFKKSVEQFGGYCNHDNINGYCDSHLLPHVMNRIKNNIDIKL